MPFQNPEVNIPLSLIAAAIGVFLLVGSARTWGWRTVVETVANALAVLAFTLLLAVLGHGLLR